MALALLAGGEDERELLEALGAARTPLGRTLYDAKWALRRLVWLAGWLAAGCCCVGSRSSQARISFPCAPALLPCPHNPPRPPAPRRFALRLCQERGRPRACVALLCELGLLEAAVALALQRGDLQLAKSVAARGWPGPAAAAAAAAAGAAGCC
jgi:hypothetical protein